MNKVKELLTKYELKQQFLATALGKSREYVQKLSTGQCRIPRILLKDLKKIEDYLKMFPKTCKSKKD